MSILSAWKTRPSIFRRKSAPVTSAQVSGNQRALDLYSKYVARAKKADPDITAVTFAPIKAVVLSTVAAIGYDRTETVLQTALQRRYRPSLVADLLTKAIDEFGETDSESDGEAEDETDYELEGGPVSIEEKPAKTWFKFKRPSINTREWGLWVLLGLFAVALVYSLFFGDSTTVVQTVTTEVIPPAPQSQPLDIPGASGLRVLQWFITIAIVVSMWANFRDAKQRGQTLDAVVAILAAGLIMATPFFSVKFQTWVQPRFFSWVVITVSLGFVAFVCYDSGKDFTPLSSFLKIVAGSAMLFGSLGAIQIAFNIPDASVLSLWQIIIVASNGEFSKIWLSLIIYAILLGSLAISTRELGNKTRRLKTDGEKIGSLLRSQAGIMVYVMLRVLAGRNLFTLQNWPLLSFLIAAILAAYIISLRQEEGPAGPIQMRQDATQIPTQWHIPWDRLDIQAGEAILWIALFGFV